MFDQRQVCKMLNSLKAIKFPATVGSNRLILEAIKLPIVRQHPKHLDFIQSTEQLGSIRLVSRGKQWVINC